MAATKKLSQPSDEKIKALIKKHGITRLDASDLLHVSIHTFDSWCVPETSSKHRAMPLPMWELLLLKLDAHPTKIMIDR